MAKRSAMLALAATLSLGLPAHAQDRLPPLPSGQMSAEQAAAAQQFLDTRKVPVFGPFVPLLRSPELMLRAKEMGDYLRYRSALPPRLSELAILLTARAWSQNVEWEIHHPEAIKAGLAASTIDAIASGRRPDRLAADEAAVYDVTTQLEQSKKVDDATYARAVALLGARGVVDLVGINGYYTLLAMILNTAQTPAKDAATFR
jgi:4-carboxymuconolactone decarboxylase